MTHALARTPHRPPVLLPKSLAGVRPYAGEIAAHAVGLTKTRSWRRGLSLARPDGEFMYALLNVGGLGATVSLLTQYITPITVRAMLVQ